MPSYEKIHNRKNRPLKRLLIVKTGAAGDVLRTTVLLRFYADWEIDWLVASENRQLLDDRRLSRVFDNVGVLNQARPYDLVICLEDDEAFVGEVFARVRTPRVFGSYIGPDHRITYTEDSAGWFDLSLISRFGITKANELKLRNRKSYQELIVSALGMKFRDEGYVMPSITKQSSLEGDVAIAARAGGRWPTKTWAHFGRLSEELSKECLVNILPARPTLEEHMADVRQHRLLITPDSLPMHIAIGFGIPTIAIFTCTSPWEIEEYGILTKVVSPKLEQYFYSREYSEDAVTSVPYHEVLTLARQKLKTIPGTPR